MSFNRLRTLLHQEKFKFKLNIAFKGAKIIYQKEFTPQCRKWVNDLYHASLSEINKQIKITLYPITRHYFERYYAILYTGKNAAVRAHKDAHSDSEFRATIVLDLNNPPHFMLYDQSNQVVHADEQIDDLYVFNGSTTRHELIRSETQTSDSKRLVLIFTYTTKMNDNRNEMNLCICSKLYGRGRKKEQNETR